MQKSIFKGSKLRLPEDWKYSTKVLKEDSVLEAKGVAYVIHDELENTCQKMTD